MELRREDVARLPRRAGAGEGRPPAARGYLEGAQELCRRYGTLFCVDEVQTGFGRTGKLFAFEHWGLEPDLVPVAKSLSGGYVPVGALLMSKWVHERVFDSMENAFSHGSTFAPNELAMAAGLATLRELDEQGLVERSAQLGERLLELTAPLVDRHEVVRDVRGLGLMWAIEFGEPESRTRTYRLVERLQHGLFAQLVVVPLFREHRILIQVAGHGIPVIKGLPPLTSPTTTSSGFAEALEATIAKAQRLPRAMAGFALTAAGSADVSAVRRGPRRARGGCGRRRRGRAALRSVPGPTSTSSASVGARRARRRPAIEGGRIPTPDDPDFPSPPPGAIVLAREAGDRALALARRCPGSCASRCSAPAGPGAAGLEGVAAVRAAAT